jgi:dTDP-4-dehydrorhamnose 3,5-epimerase
VRFEATPLASAYVIRLELRVDDRGFFARTFCEDEFATKGLPARFPQCNLSRNRRRGTLRGMHFNAAPFRESKVVRCVAGAIHDVIVDLREGSPTRFASFGVELSHKNGAALFVPEGFAHGFVTLVDDTDVFYQMGGRFEADAARGFRWDDPTFSIRWPIVPSIVSERDATYPDFDLEAFDG